jgi:hypothetical protein
MADFAIYWKNLAKDCERYGYGPDKPLFDWRTNSERLFRQLGRGGRLWFIASGTTCGAAESTSAYLVNAYRVDRVETNTGDDPIYPPDEFRYTVWADRATCRWMDPPLLIDALLRPAGRKADRHIGNSLQAPRRLGDEALANLQQLLRVSGREPV